MVENLTVAMLQIISIMFSVAAKQMISSQQRKAQRAQSRVLIRGPGYLLVPTLQAQTGFSLHWPIILNDTQVSSTRQTGAVPPQTKRPRVANSSAGRYSSSRDLTKESLTSRQRAIEYPCRSQSRLADTSQTTVTSGKHVGVAA